LVKDLSLKINQEPFIYHLWRNISRLNPKSVVWGTLILFALSAVLATRIGFSYQFDDFFPKEDAELDFYYAYRERLAPDDNFLLIGCPVEKLFDQKFLHALDTATYQINRLNETDRAFSVAGYRYLIYTPFGYLDYPAIHTDDPASYQEDSLRLREDERVMGKLVSTDFKTAIIFIQTKDSLQQDQNKALIKGVESILQSAGIQDYHLIGKAYFEVELVQFQQREFMLFALLSMLLVTAVIYFLFRNWWIVFIALITVTVCLVLFLGLLGLLNADLNVISSLFPIVLIIVGISDVIHLITRYSTEINSGFTRREALFITLKDVGLATFLTSATTAVGFLTLLTSVIIPIREFGLLAAAGVMIAYLVALFFTAPLLLLFGQKHLQQQERSDRRWATFLSFIYSSGQRHPYMVTITAVILSLAGAAGTWMITTDIQLQSSLPKNTRVTEDFTFFEEAFNGFRPLEIAAIAQNGHRVDEPAVLQEIDSFEQYASQFDIINGLQSVTMFYKSLNRARSGDRDSEYALPDDAGRFTAIQHDLDRFAGDDMKLFLSEDRKWGRISGSVSDRGTDKIQATQDSLMNYAQNEIDTSLVKFRITGTGIIFDKNNEYIRQNVLYGVFIALGVISLLMGALFRDWKLLLISMVPNTLPLLICGGVLGYFQIPLDAPTAIIFGISYGIVVDDTIHFLSRFKIERDKGVNQEAALKRTFHETGKAIFMTTLILVLGFSVLMFSSLQATFNVGLLIGITLLSAVFADVYLLPLMLRKWLKRQ
jgi:hydrophobe/amphiphile efflux-3 (HAE3) family protein